MKRPNMLMAACVSLFLTACSGNAVLNESLNDQGVPSWVSEGSNIFKSKQGRLFHGVGSAPMLGDFSLQTAAANRRAREEFARIVSSYVEIVSREYIATGQATHAGFNEQVVMRHVNKLAKMDLSKVEVVGHWTDGESKVIYAIAQMDIERVRQMIRDIVSTNKGLSAYINVEGNSIFDRMAKKE